MSISAVPVTSQLLDIATTTTAVPMVQEIPGMLYDSRNGLLVLYVGHVNYV